LKVKVRTIGVSKPPEGYEDQKTVPMVFSGESVKDLIQHLLSEMDSEMTDIFLNEQGEISPDLAIIVNGIAASFSNRSNLHLKEGDLVELVSAPG
jgi:hypothetical protein